MVPSEIGRQNTVETPWKIVARHANLPLMFPSKPQGSHYALRTTGVHTINPQFEKWMNSIAGVFR